MNIPVSAGLNWASARFHPAWLWDVTRYVLVHDIYHVLVRRYTRRIRCRHFGNPETPGVVPGRHRLRGRPRTTPEPHIRTYSHTRLHISVHILGHLGFYHIGSSHFGPSEQSRTPANLFLGCLGAILVTTLLGHHVLYHHVPSKQNRTPANFSWAVLGPSC